MENVINSQISEDEIKNILIQSIRKTGNHLNLLQKVKAEPVHKIYEILVDHKKMKLSNVPKKYRTLECCKTAVKYSIAAIKSVPPEIKTKQFYEYFIKNGGCFDYRRYKSNVLKMIPIEFRTYDICKAALQRRVGKLQDVPFEHRDSTLCKIAVKERLCTLYKNKITDIIPQYSIDEELILDLIRKDLRLYYDPIVQDNYNTQNVFNQYLKRITRDELGKLSIPVQFQNQQTYKNLLMNEFYIGSDLMFENYIPEEFKSEAMYVIAIKHKPNNVFRIPPQKITYQIVKTIAYFKPKLIMSKYVQQNKNRVNSKILSLMNEQLYYMIFERLFMCFQTRILEYVPIEYRSTRICQAAIKRDYKQIVSVPEKLKTRQMYYILLKSITKRTTIKTIKNMLSYIPDEFKTTETFIDLIKLNPAILSIVPKKFKTPQLYKVAAEKDPKYLSKIL